VPTSQFKNMEVPMKINCLSCDYKVDQDDSTKLTEEVFALKVEDDSMVGL